MQALIVGEPNDHKRQGSPVDVTPQLTTKVKTPPCRKRGTAAPAVSEASDTFWLGAPTVPPGHTARFPLLEVQTALPVHERPALGVSRMIPPSAAAGPALENVTVYCVVLPATRVFVPLVLVTESSA